MSLEQALQANTEALNALTAALKAGGVSTSASTTSTSTKTSASGDDEKKGPFLWHDATANKIGEEKNFTALKKVLSGNSDAARITQEAYDRIKAELDAADDDAEGDDDSEENYPSVEDVKKAFGGFLKIDDEKKRENRKKFALTLLKQFGVERSSELEPKHRAEAIQFIEDALAGKKVKAEDANKGGDDDADEDEDGMI